MFIGDKGLFRGSSAYKSLSKQAEIYEDEDMITVVGCREPFKFVCSIGPGCPNHDWSLVSPLHLIRKKNNRLCKKPNEMKHAKPMTYELMLTKPKVCARHGWT